nr:Chain D, CASP peptide [Neisseria gonorrhoeae]
CTNEDGKPC